MLGENSAFNRLFINHYYEMKRRNGYSDLEIAQKREALENVLVPYRLEENKELLRECGLPARRRLLQVVQLLRDDRDEVTSAPTPHVTSSPVTSWLIHRAFLLQGPRYRFPGRPPDAGVQHQAARHRRRLVARPQDGSAGFAVASVGELLSVAVIGFAYIIARRPDRRIFADSLVQTGIFAHSRNPLYLGNLLIVAGLAIMHGSWWFYLVGLPFFVFAYMSPSSAPEEDFLGQKFGGEYEDYCRRVNRFIPSLRGLRRRSLP